MKHMIIKSDQNIIKSMINILFSISKTAAVCFGLLILMMPDRMTAQCENINLACNDVVNVSINEDCYASVNADLILEDPPFSLFADNGVNYDILLQDENGYPILPSNQLSEEHVGRRIKATVSLVPCNISCWGYIQVEDKIGPKIWGCIDGYLPDIELDCDVFSDNYEIPEPVLGGICKNIDALSFEDDTSSLDCRNNFAFTISRLWVARDDAGNKTNCRQRINVNRINLEDVIVPDDYIVYMDPDEECHESQDVSPERTGYPTGLACPNIKYYFSDITYPQCGRQVKLLRDWFVMDWCTGQSISFGQIIKIIDHTAPKVVCHLDTIQVAKAPYNCEASPFLNPLRIPGFDTLGAVTVLDTCPEDIFVEVAYLPAVEGKEQPLDSPYYTIDPDEDGLYKVPYFEERVWVRYCFRDACGNETEIPDNAIWADSVGYCCYFILEAQDKTPPTAICEGFTKIPLGSQGITEVPAERFDDHSYDPCDGVSHFEVRRENYSCAGYEEHGKLGWSESLHFCCEDLGDTITIRLRVFDQSGNFSECLGLVCVSEAGPPVVQCPDPYVQLDCDEDYRNYNIIGYPEAENGCSYDINIGKEEFDLSYFDIACGTGSIFRSIEVLDNNDNVAVECQQEIKFRDDVSVQLEYGDFDFPDDITIDICSTGGSLDPGFTGLPHSDKEFGCSNIAISYQDSPPITQNSNGICYTILREWRVVDWCNYHPAYPNLYVLKTTQEIRVSNSAEPEFICPGDITVKTTTFECEAEVNLVVNTASVCPSSFDVYWSIDAFSDGTTDINGAGNDATGVYPVGTHTITFAGYNYCGGGAESCSYSFTVESDKAPVPICVAELSWSVGSNGTAEVWASDFDLKSESGCAQGPISFSFVAPTEATYPELSRSFDCSDIPNGISEALELDVYVIDDEGRFSSCRSTLNLRDTGDHCPDQQGNLNTIGGEIHTEILEPMEQVMLELLDMDNEGLMTEITGINGAFTFDNVSSTGHYELKPTHDKDYLNGVSTLDLLIIQRHILGLERIESPYKLIAADIDKSLSITALDLIQLRKLILGIYDDLPEADSWTFVPAAHKFVDPSSPWAYPQYLDIESLKETMLDADFVAVKLGDVNNSVNLTSSLPIQKRNSDDVFLSSYSAEFSTGELVDVPVIIQNDISVYGMQFTFEFDDEALLFQGVDSGRLSVGDENFALLNREAGKITFSITSLDALGLKEGDVLFHIYFEARENVVTEEMIDINSSVTRAELYDSYGQVRPIDFVLKNKELDRRELQLFQNEPNPFTASTNISFYNPEAQMLKLQLMDSTGKLLKTYQAYFESGMQKINIRSEDLDATGVLFYRLQSAGKAITRKMIMVK
jgi:hypothetical protein